MNLIYDRTQEDIDKETDKAFIDYVDLNRIKNAIAELKTAAESIGYTFVQDFTKTWTISDIRNKTEIDKLKNDLARIRGLIVCPSGTPNVPTTPFADYRSANDTENIIQTVYSLIEGMKIQARYSGEIYAGEE